MHIVVFGAGGIGGYFGGRLAHAGEKVTFIARGEHLQSMLANGLQVKSFMGDFSIHPVTATDDPSTIKDVDVILMCVKAWQVPAAAKAVLSILSSETFVVPLENGIEAPSQLCEILGREHVLGGLCGIFSHIASPGCIEHTGAEPWIAFSELDNHRSPRVQVIKQIFERAGVDVTIPRDINYALWQKLFFVSGFSAIGALTRVPVGSFRSMPGTREILEAAFKECYQVAWANGIHLPEEIIANTLVSIDAYPPDTISSLQRDIMDGSPSELEEQIGIIVRMGQTHNIPTPVYSFIYNSLLPLEKLAREMMD
jgi:2-dehydropantoate 2-reductase